MFDGTEIKKKIEINQKAIDKLMNDESGFHDCRIINVNSNFKENVTLVFLETCNKGEMITLEFSNVKSAFLRPFDDYLYGWIYNTDMIISSEGTVIWYDSAEPGYTFDEMKNYRTWIEAEGLNVIHSNLRD